MAKFGLSPIQKDPLEYAGQKTATIPTFDAPRAPTILDRKFPIQSIWRDNITNDEWILVDVINGDAQWRLLTGGSAGTVTNLRADDGNTALPNSGVIDIDGNTVAAGTNATPLFTKADVANSVDFELQVSSDITGAPADKNDAGICSFNDTQFTVTTHGYVSLAGGGTAIDSLTGDTGGAVSPDGAGNIDIFGDTTQSYISVDGTPASNQLELKLIEPAVNGELLIGNTGNSAPDVATLTEGLGITITNGPGSIRIDSDPANVQGYGNLGVTYNGGTGVFEVTGANGALSATNFATVTFQSKATPGQLVTIKVTANQGFIDDAGASEIIGNLFGLTTSIAWTNPMPFFLYAVLNDDEDSVAFGISRSPISTTSPGAAAIGTPASATANNQEGLFLFDSVTIANYDNNPVVRLGSIRMVMSASDDWTVQTLDVKDGIGQYQTQRIFTCDTGQFGASASSHFSSSVGGDTLPGFTTNGMVYYINTDGMVTVSWNAQACNSSGVGAGNLRLHLPFIPLLSNTQYGPGNMTWLVNATGFYNVYLTARNSAPSVNYFFFVKDGGGVLTPADFVNTDSPFAMTAQYRTSQQQL